MCEEKKKVAVVSLIALGLGAAYLLREDLGEIACSEKYSKKILVSEVSEKVKEELKNTEENSTFYEEEKIEEKREKFPGRELFNVSWSYLRRLLGSRYPGDDMSRIYPMLDEKIRRMWRRGIYNNNPQSYPDKLFVYHDAYYLVLAGWEELRDAFNAYAMGRTDFNSFFNSYLNVAKKLLNMYP